MKKSFLIVSGLVLAALPLCARTVALWPLNWDATADKPSGACAIAAENNLAIHSRATFTRDTTDIGWTLPPNPETRNLRFPSKRTDAAYGSVSSSSDNVGWLFANMNASFLAHVSVTNDFTLEGWFRMPVLPASGKFYFIANGDGNNASATCQRWFLTLRHNSPANSGVTWQIFSQRHNTGDAILATLDAAQVVSLTNGWHHFALSLEQRASDVVWRFYQDGTLLGSKTASKCTGNVASVNCFVLGGRNVDEWERIMKGSFSYCRFSDKALEPEDFLNWGGNMNRTMALWKLDRDAHGGINGAPSIGDEHLTGGFIAFHPWDMSGSAYSAGRFYPDSDCAFVGNPPNPTVTLPDGNAGSLFSRKYAMDSRLVVHEMGSELSLTNDFTVEGWLKLECRDSIYGLESLSRKRHLCGTRPGSVGWVLQLRRKSGMCEAVVFAQDETGVVMPEATLGDIAACEGRWVHLALSYDHEAGENATGVWNFYRDGVWTGSATNSVAPRDGAVDATSRRLIFGPQTTWSVYSLPGKIDCWRASRAVLQPSQFLCATNGTAATDVLALWPMNTKNGLYIDGTDVIDGKYTFEDPLGAQYMVVSGDGAPEVPGLSAAANGCAEFRSADGNDRKLSYVICHDEDAVGTLANTNGCTLEVYLYPTYQPTGSEYEFIFIANNGALGRLGENSVGYTHINLTYRAGGFILWVTDVVSDRQFLDGDGQPILLPLNTWSHLALTFHKEGATCVFDLYIDGTKRGTISASGTPRVPSLLLLGGRYTSESSFRGKMSLLRISKGVLSANEFMCARSAVPESRAYWPLDGASALDLTGRINGTDGLSDFTAASGVTGLAAGARNRVPRPDTSPNFTGDASANAGAVQMAVGGYAQASLAGSYVDIDDSFTVEGWINWACSQGAAAEVICDTYAGGKGGWKLVLDSTGTVPAVRLYAAGAFPVSVLADGVLMADASSLEGSWHHLALRYDAVAGDGVWSLLVDGEVTGSVTNAWRPSGIFDRAEFRLGAFGGDTTFAGGYDVWRISRGVRSADDILWMPPKGTLMIFR